MFFLTSIAQQIVFLVANPRSSADGRRGEEKSNSMPWEPGLVIYKWPQWAAIILGMDTAQVPLSPILSQHSEATEIQETKSSTAD